MPMTGVREAVMVCKSATSVLVITSPTDFCVGSLCSDRGRQCMGWPHSFYYELPARVL